MRIFIDIRSLDTKQITGVPEYVRLLIEHLLREAPREQYTFFANSFSHRLEKTDLLQRQRGDWINFGIPNRIFDLTNHFLNFPKIDSLIPADVFYSPHFNILSFKRTLEAHSYHPRHFFHPLSRILFPTETAVALAAKLAETDGNRRPDHHQCRLYSRGHH